MNRALATVCLCGIGTVAVGCSIYVPTLNHTPLVSRPGDAELGIAARALTQAEAFAAYSPLRHVVMTGGVQSLWPLPTGDRETSAVQGDAGLGMYTRVRSDRWYVGAIGGYGKAKSANRYAVPGSPLKDYRARYTRRYGQGYAALNTSSVAFGVSLRWTRLRIDELTLNGGPVGAEELARNHIAPSAFLRMGSDRVQVQLHFGASYPQGARSNDTDVSDAMNVIGVSMAITPHLFRRPLR